MSHIAFSTLRTAALALGALALSTSVGLAQAWPSRAITMIVPAAAGGGADPVARLVAEGMAKRLGQPVVVDFRPGANGTIGVSQLVRANPDGYSILFSSGSATVAMKLVMKDLSYDPDTDLVPIIIPMNSPDAIIASMKFAPKDFKEFIDYGLKNPGKINVSVPSLGGGGHQATILMEQTLGLKMNLVPYRGTGTIMPDILASVVDVSSDFPAAYIPQAKANKVRILAVLSEQRLPALPDVPTSAELGYPQLIVGGWYGMYAPKGTPEAITKRINEVVNETLQEKDTREKIEGLGYQVLGGTPADLLKVIARDKTNIGKMVQSGALKIE